MTRRQFFLSVTGIGIGLTAAPGIFPKYKNSPNSGKDTLDFQALLQPVPARAKFSDPDYYIWGASIVRASDEKCHLYYSRWERELGHNAWVTHSEVAHAVADHPPGPYHHVDVALPPRGKEYWDGLCTHNPTVMHHEGMYYLYYMGNTGNGKNMERLNWTHRNNQRIGVAVSEYPAGPWQRFESPVIDVGNASAPDALMASNPSVAQRPEGGFLMVYKAVGLERPRPFGGPVVHLVAVSDSPTGPFRKDPDPVFTAEGSDFPAEDPYIWYSVSHERYYAIVKDMHGAFTDAGQSLALFQSGDGYKWALASHPLVSDLTIHWADGERQQVDHLERPQLWRQNGEPAVLFLAADTGKERSHSFNVAVPLKEGL